MHTKNRNRVAFIIVILVLGMSASASAQNPPPQPTPPTPTHTGWASLVKDTAHDFVAFPKRKSTWAILGIGAVGALAVHPADDYVAEHIVGNERRRGLLRARQVDWELAGTSRERRGTLGRRQIRDSACGRRVAHQQSVAPGLRFAARPHGVSSAGRWIEASRSPRSADR